LYFVGDILTIIQNRQIYCHICLFIFKAIVKKSILFLLNLQTITILKIYG